MTRLRERRQFVAALVGAAVTIAALLFLLLQSAWLPFARLHWGRTGTVALLDPGAGPRRLLRYAWSAPPRPFTLLVQRGMARIRGVLQVQEDYGPPTAFHLVPEESVVRLGVARVTWKLGAASTTSDEKVTPEALRATDAAAQRLVGRQLVTYLGPVGQTEVDVTYPSDVLDRRLLEEVVRVLELELAPRLPDAPVGPGARWQTTHSRKLALAESVQCTSVFRLTDVEPDSIDLDVTLSVSAEPQHPAPVAGVTDPVLIDRVEGTLEGRIVRLLGEPTPVLSDLSLEAGMSLTQIEANQREPTDEQRRTGYRLVVTSRESMKADALGLSELPLQRGDP
jgi:hypothetical protein